MTSNEPRATSNGATTVEQFDESELEHVGFQDLS
jgi:hypothetical protein